MRRDVVYRGWRVLACLLSIVSGVALWVAGERLFAVLGIAAGAFHALRGMDLPALVRGRLRRRAILIPQLRPMLILPPPRTLAQRLHAAWRRHG